IQDNGVGRLGAKKRNLHPDDGHKSMGNQITQERLLLLQPVRSDRFKILDLSDADGNATGTLVEIRIPIQFM
ncbi:MAG: sensor histidine kinase, partial [Bacteroidia bacterium]|nr:sensor histidine kinase [Bacteroidia bacterium]